MSFFFIAAEMVSELALDLSNKWSIKKLTRNVIGTTIPDKLVPRVLFVSTASGIRLLNFDDGPLEFVSSEFPVALNHSFCFKCMKFN